MATLDEIASGVVQMLALEGLSPPPVELRNHSPAEFAKFVTMVIDRCYTEAVPLKAVKMSPDFGDELRHLVDWQGGYRGVPIHFDESLGRSIQFVPGSAIHWGAGMGLRRKAQSGMAQTSGDGCRVAGHRHRTSTELNQQPLAVSIREI